MTCLLIEAWRDEVVPRPVARVPEKVTSKGYSVLFHEAMVPNMLGPFLNHEHACKVMGGAPLLELIDFCMRKIMRLHYRLPAARRGGEGVVHAGQGARHAAGDCEKLSHSPPPAAARLPPCARSAPLASDGICTIYLGMWWLPGPPGAPVTAAENELELRWAAAGGVSRGVSVVTADCRQSAQ